MLRNGPDPEATNTYRFATPRLSMELPRHQDAPHLFALIGGADRRAVCSTLLWDGPDEVGEIEDWIERCRSESFGEAGFHWVIRDPSGKIAGRPGLPLGAIGTRPRGWPGRADVGYWLGKQYWGRGLMTEALLGLLALGFGTLGYAKVEAEVFAENRRGLRLVERVGMKREGLVRRAVRKYGDWVDEALYGVLFEEWVEP